MRRANKAKLHEMIEIAKGEGERTSTSTYKSDELSEKLAKKYIKSQLMKRVPPWQKYGTRESKEVQDQVEKGIFPKNWNY